MDDREVDSSRTFVVHGCVLPSFLSKPLGFCWVVVEPEDRHCQLRLAQELGEWSSCGPHLQSLRLSGEAVSGACSSALGTASRPSCCLVTSRMMPRGETGSVSKAVVYTSSDCDLYIFVDTAFNNPELRLMTSRAEASETSLWGTITCRALP